MNIPGFFHNALLMIPAAAALGVLSSVSRAEHGVAFLRVPPGFAVERAAGPDLAPYPMFAALDDRRRLFVAESSGKNIKGLAMSQNPECRIRLLEDRDGDGIYDRSIVFADKVGIPMGVLWHDGAVFVASPPDLLRFDDDDGDGVADRRTVLLTGWHVRGTASLHGPFLGPDGWLYLTDGRHGFDIQTKEGTNLKGLASRIWRCRTDGTGLESFAGGGFDNPVEIIFTPAGEMIGTMTYFTDPKNGQRDGLMHFIEGGVYSKWHDCVKEFKLTGDLMPPMTKFARIAPAGLARHSGLSFGPEYRGNLFSAQFNPNRIQRHIVIEDGATFRTEDEDFLVSSDPDFRPCDVLEDADGSLLVVDTGAWYVDQCPLSRISKPELKGGIYRVTRTGSRPASDPRGERLDLASQSPGKLSGFLEDARPFVRDAARELLVKRGGTSIPALNGLLKNSASAEARCEAVWALMRIGGTAAMEGIRAALKDSHADVRTAAANALGTARYAPAAADLARLVLSDAPHVRRAAATALGRTGGQGVSYALLGAAPGADRFLEHAIIYSLIQLQDAPTALAALNNGSAPPAARKAALVALDQMDGGQLPRERLAPLLGDRDRDLSRAALWVFSRHPEWAGGVVGYLRDRLAGGAIAEEDGELVGEAFASFSSDAGMQAMVAGLLGRSELDPARQIFLLDCIGKSPLKALPADWTQRLGEKLKQGGIEVRLRVIALLRARGIGDHDAALGSIAADAAEPARLRIDALSVRMTRRPQLSDLEFQFLLGQMQANNEHTSRNAAFAAMGRARLGEGQLRRLAEVGIGMADPLHLPVMLEAFIAGRDEQAGRAMIEALLSFPRGLETLNTAFMERLLSTYPATVTAATGPLMERLKSQEQARIRRLDELEPLLRGGDVGRGRRVFFSQKAACSSCHAIGNEGSRFGPDLTAVGAIRSGRDLLEAIVFPSASQVPGYETFHVETDGDEQAGVIARETADAVWLRTATSEIRLARESIRTIKPGSLSLMPEGLDTVLSREELLDLMAFLQSQNGEQWLQPQRLGTKDLRQQQQARP